MHSYMRVNIMITSINLTNGVATEGELLDLQPSTTPRQFFDTYKII